MSEEDNILFLTQKLQRKENKIEQLKDEMRILESKINNLEKNDNRDDEMKAKVEEFDWFLNEVCQIFGETLKTPRELLVTIKCSKDQAVQLSRNEQTTLIRNGTGCGDMKAKILELTNREEELELALEEKETLVQKFKKQNKMKEDQLNELKEEMEQIQNQKSGQSNKKKLKEMKQNQIAMDEKIEDMESEIRKKNRKLKECDEIIKTHSLEINDVKDELRKKETENRDLMNQVSKEKINSTSTIENNICKHRDEVRQLNNEINELKEKLEKKHEALIIIKAKFNKGEEDLKKKQTEYLDLQTEKKVTESQSKKQIDIMEAKLSDLQAEKKLMESQWKKQVDMKEAEFNAKGKELEALSRKLRNSEDKIEQMTEKLHQNEKEVKEEKEKYEYVHGLYSTAKKKIENKEKNIKILEKELAEMKRTNVKKVTTEPDWWKIYQKPVKQIIPNTLVIPNTKKLRRKAYINDIKNSNGYPRLSLANDLNIPQQLHKWPTFQEYDNE